MTDEEKREYENRRFEERKKAIKTEAGGGAYTKKAEQQAQRGEGVHKFVDPREFNGTRQAMSLKVAQGDQFLLKFGIAIPVLKLYDTTGSMGHNIDAAMETVPEMQELLVMGERAILRRYNAQFAIGNIQDRLDRHMFLVTQFEMDDRIASQIASLDVQRAGDDDEEEYDVALWYANRIQADIFRYGLKGHLGIVGDEMGRSYVYRDFIRKMMGSYCDLQSDLSTAEVAREVMRKWHTFFYQITGGVQGSSSRIAKVTDWWRDIIGPERIIRVDRTEDVAKVQAVVIGLSEGVLSLSDVPDYLTDVTRISKEQAGKIARAVANVPVGAQAALPNFGKIPPRGSLFAAKDDLWPIPAVAPTESAAPAGGVGWKL